MMFVLVRRNGSSALLVKGAPKSVVERCAYILVNGHTIPLTAELRSALLRQTLAYGTQNLRTLALAYTDERDLDPSHYQTESTADYARFERELTFVSLVGMLDLPRPELRLAVANCKAAGIRANSITGDNKGTAETICRQIGIFGKDEDLTGMTYTGRELDALSQGEKVHAVMHTSLFSRKETRASWSTCCRAKVLWLRW